MDTKLALLLSAAMFFSACSSESGLAKIDGKPISEAQFVAHLEFKRISPENEALAKQELELYLQQTALAAAIEKSGKADLDRLNAEIEEFKKQSLISNYMATYLDGIVNDSAIENYYAQNAERFSQQRFRAAHIIFRAHQSMSEAENQAAAQKAREVIAKLAQGEAFDELARASSEDVFTAPSGGDLGWVNVNSIDPVFMAAVKGLEVGQTSEVVKTQFGYHVIKLLEPLQFEPTPLEQVRGDIRYELRQKAKAAETERLFASISVERAD